MSRWYLRLFSHIDWILVLALVPILSAGLATMHSFVDTDVYFVRQLVWIGISFVAFLFISLFDAKTLRRTRVVMWLYVGVCVLLMSLFFLGSVFQGAKSWLDFGFFAVQPAEIAKLVLILVLAKYLSRRHVEIRNFKHVLVSGVYAGLIFLLILIQPDFGSALIVFLLWFGMILFSGIDKKHLALVIFSGASIFILMWTFVFADYQKARIMTFINPLQDIRGTGYNAYQSVISVGSGQLFGKGFGYGTQSRLEFLPEYQTDFIFAAFAEEWGFIGVCILIALYGVLISRIIRSAITAATNFEAFYAVGLAILLMSHLLIHIGMNVGLMPVTGLTIPFMSYGGTNLLVIFIGLGLLMGMRRYSRATHKDMISNEFIGPR